MNINTNTSSGGGLFGNTSSQSKPLFGSNTNNTLFGNNTTNNSSTNSSFGFGNNNNTNTSGGLFGNNNTNNKPTGLFGNSSNNNSTSGTLFGNASNNNTSSGSLFGNNNNNSSLFGNNSNNANSSFSLNNNNQTNSLFNSSNTSGGGLFSNSSNQQPISQQQDPNSQSLFGMRSSFSYSSDTDTIHKLAEENLRRSTNNLNSTFQTSQNSLSLSNNGAGFNSTVSSQPQSLYNSPQQIGNASFSGTASFGNTNQRTSNGLRHSQSSIVLGSGASNASPYRRRSNVPGWAQERRYVPNQTSSLRHVSSFNKTERTTSTTTPGHRKSSTSPSQSPSNSFGGSFSGIPKTSSHTKKKTFIQEDPPPTRSIYDLESSNLDLIKTDTPSDTAADNENALRRPSSTPSDKKGNEPSSAYNRYAGSSIIIFGFPPSLAPEVIAHFANFGTILENVDSTSRIFNRTPSKGGNSHSAPILTGKNWMKITYDNPASASRALQENGFLLHDLYYIGCMPLTAQKLKEFENSSQASMNAAELSVDGMDTSYSNNNFFNGENSLLNSTIPEEPGAEVRMLDSQPANTEHDFNNSQSSLIAGTKKLLNIASNTILSPHNAENNDEANGNQAINGKTLPRTVSLPVLAGSKRAAIKDGRHIFNSPAKQARYPSTPAIFKQNENRHANGYASRNGAVSGDESKKLQNNKPGWMSWTSKKAQEFVFGWDEV